MLRTLLLPLLFCTTGLLGQSDPVNDLSEHAQQKDRATQEFMNNTAAEASLVNGGAFYVSNPPPSYKVDVDKAYLDKEFRKMHVTFRSGDTATIFARIRVIDQKVELMREGGVYELRDNYTESIETESGETYLFLLDPLLRSKGTGVYQRAFTGGGFNLLVHRTADWKETRPKNDVRHQ